MASLVFPDVNVWLALLMADHSHRSAATKWWDQDGSDGIAFVRFTQLGVLRLLTTTAAMNGKPLTMSQAWKAHDALYGDPRVTFVSEPASLDESIRRATVGRSSSPKLWADAYLSAVAFRAGGKLVTFDKALAAHSETSMLLR